MYRWACDNTLNKHDKNFPKSIEQHWTLPNMTSWRKYIRLTTSYTNIEVFDLWQRLWRGIHPCVQINCHCWQHPLLYRTPYLLQCCRLHPRRNTLFPMVTCLSIYHEVFNGWNCIETDKSIMLSTCN